MKYSVSVVHTSMNLTIHIAVSVIRSGYIKEHLLVYERLKRGKKIHSLYLGAGIFVDDESVNCTSFGDCMCVRKNILLKRLLHLF